MPFDVEKEVFNIAYNNDESATQINKFRLRGRSIEAKIMMIGNHGNAAGYKAGFRDVVVSSGTVLISIMEGWFADYLSYRR